MFRKVELAVSILAGLSLDITLPRKWLGSFKCIMRSHSFSFSVAFLIVTDNQEDFALIGRRVPLNFLPP